MKLFLPLVLVMLPSANSADLEPTVVFMSGIGGYPCVRVPSLIAVPGAILAFAECRSFVGDGGYWVDIVIY
jgi:hypothetical protein